MRPFAWSFVATGIATALLAAGGAHASDGTLRGMGAVGGAVLALAGVVLGVRGARRRVTPDSAPPGPRFFLERRKAPRHDVRIPVRFAVNGSAYPATLVSISASGALLRLATEPGAMLHAQVGQPVHIDDYPPGTLARIGTHGVYVDFAVRFETATAGAPSPTRPLAEAVAVRSSRL